MGNSDGARWPSFELTLFPPSARIPAEMTQSLRSEGVPKQLFRYYKADKSLSVVHDHRYGDLVRFGTSGQIAAVCLDPRGGEVVLLVNPLQVEGSPAWLVNSSLEKFRSSVKAVIDRFPYYTAEDYAQEDGLENATRVAHEVIGLIGDIDPAAVQERDGFWWTFADDVTIGDYATEDILG